MALPVASREKPHTLCVESAQPLLADEHADWLAAHQNRTPPHLTMPGSQPKSFSVLRQDDVVALQVTPSPQLTGLAELPAQGSLPVQAPLSGAQEPSEQRFLPEPHCLTAACPESAAAYSVVFVASTHKDGRLTHVERLTATTKSSSPQ